MSARNRRKVLLVTVGRGDDWKHLRSHLEGSGWTVLPQEMEQVIKEGGPRFDSPRLEGVELAILVVGSYQGTESNLRATRSLLHYAGLLQGQLGYRRVLAMVEARVDAFLEGTGVPELSFTAGNIQDRYRQVAATLQDLESNPPQGRVRSGFERWMSRMGLQHTEIASEVWLWAGGLVIAALCLTVLYLIFADPLRPEGEVDASATVVTGAITEDVPAGEVGSASSTLATTTATDGTAGPEPPADRGPVPPINEGNLPGAIGGRVDTLPSRCTVLTISGEVTPEQLSCEGNGGLLATGFAGPWHDEISAVTLSQGSVGEAILSPQAGGSTASRVQLDPGRRTELEPFGSLAGTDQLVLEFSANNESVVLHQSPDRGGQELLLTFSLDMQ